MQPSALAWLGLLGLAGCPEPPEQRAEPTPSALAQPAPLAEPAPTKVVAGLRELPLPVSPGSTSPNVHIDGSGRMYLSWLEPVGAEQYALRMALHDANGWSEAHEVTRGAGLLVNWADVPIVGTLDDGTVLIAWLERHEREEGQDGEEGYGIQLSRSTDRGASFTHPIALQGKAVGPEFGFVSFARKNADELSVFWLDSRELEETGFMQLRSAAVGQKGGLRDMKVLDPQVCDCCQTSAISSELGQLVVYRDRTADEIRDIYIAGAGLGEGGARVFADAWKIDGCPVNGPSIAGRGRELAVAWFTGKSPPGEIKVAFTGDPERFGTPIRVDSGKPLGRVDVHMAPDGAAIVTWMEASPDDAELAEIRVRIVHKDGRMGVPRRVAMTGAARDSGFPHAVVVGNVMRWVWTDPGLQGISKVRAAEASLDALK